MLRYKITQPALPRCVDRPRLLRAVLSKSVVALAAPAGHGKTCLAAQVAAATGGPTAWFLADELDRDRATVVTQLFGALGTGWDDLDQDVPPALDDETAVPLLGAALETLAGPGCLVMDDVHLLPRAVLDAVARTAVAALPPACRLVLCTRTAVPEALLRAEAMGRAVTLGPSDLALDETECDEACASLPAGSGADVHARTGGWPLAVALIASTGRVPDDHAGALADLALGDLPARARDLLVVLARLARFPTDLLDRIGPRASSLQAFGRTHPVLFHQDDGWWTLREWMRDALVERPAETSLVDVIAHALRDLDQVELAVQLLGAEGRHHEAVPMIERLAAAALRRGRAAWTQSLIAAVPSPARTFTLDLQAATAAQQLSLVEPTGSGAGGSEQTVLHLVDRAAGEGGGPLLQAHALLASHYRMEGDARMFAVCETALGDALDDDGSLDGRWSPEDAPAAGEMLRFYGLGLMFANDRAVIERGRRLVIAGLDAAEAAGRPTLSSRAWSTYFEVLLFLRSAVDALPRIRAAAHQMAELDGTDAAVRLAELATVEFFAGQYEAARRSIELARGCADRTGNRIALPPLAAIEVALDVVDSSFTPELGDRFDRTAADLQAHPRLAPFAALIMAEFGIVLVRRAQTEAARRYLDEARKALGPTYFAHTSAYRCRRLQGLLLLAEGSVDEGRDTLRELQREAADEGRTALVTLLDEDLARPPGTFDTGGRSVSPVQVGVLAPELHVSVDGERLPPPRGYPAKLLALLVASDGAMTVDAAIEGLWPGADPATGRNRLHGVLLRLRRALGFPVGGPISCTEGVVRLAPSPRLQVDSWQFERLAQAAVSQAAARSAAVAAYPGDVLTVQYAYDETVTAYRRSLRRTYLRLAVTVLRDPPSDIDDRELSAVARSVSALAPDDEDVCRTAVRALARRGQRTEARQLVDVTAAALADLGLDGEEFRRRAAADIQTA